MLIEHRRIDVAVESVVLYLPNHGFDVVPPRGVVVKEVTVAPRSAPLSPVFPPMNFPECHASPGICKPSVEELEYAVT